MGKQDKKHVEGILLSTFKNQLWLRDKKKKPTNQASFSEVAFPTMPILCSSLDLFLKLMLPQRNRGGYAWAPVLPDLNP